MHPDEFITNLGNWAKWAAPKTGLHAVVILAQWADETGWGTSSAWVDGFNPAGISPGGQIAKYSSVEEGMTHYVTTLNLPYYDRVRSAFSSGPLAQAIALGESPWAAGHYGGQEHPGSDLVSIIDNQLAHFDGGAGTSEPAPPSSTPWYSVAAAHPKYLEAVGDVLDAFELLFDREPANPAEWSQVGHWAAAIAIDGATLAGVTVQLSEVPGAKFRLAVA
jgi:hypothetical protein